MAQDLDKLKRKLEKKICLVQFECLKTGETKTREMTTNPDWTRGMDMRAINEDTSKVDNKIIMYDVEFMKWHDIKENTILHWKEL